MIDSHGDPSVSDSYPMVNRYIPAYFLNTGTVNPILSSVMSLLNTNHSSSVQIAYTPTKYQYHSL
jgi:hypothetical protein